MNVPIFSWAALALLVLNAIQTWNLYVHSKLIASNTRKLDYYEKLSALYVTQLERQGIDVNAFIPRDLT